MCCICVKTCILLVIRNAYVRNQYQLLIDVLVDYILIISVLCVVIQWMLWWIIAKVWMLQGYEYL